MPRVLLLCAGAGACRGSPNGPGALGIPTRQGIGRHGLQPLLRGHVAFVPVIHLRVRPVHVAHALPAIAQRLEGMGDRPHPREGHVPVVEHPMAVRILAGGQRVPCRCADRGLAVALAETDALRNQPVEVWRVGDRVAETSERVTAMVIAHNDEYVHDPSCTERLAPAPRRPGRLSKCEFQSPVRGCWLVG